ncbi:MAG: preprotein translocase subunit SecG [Limnochordales bacterium]|nr:MAG: preprotein translocase subunit SecG [Bacillota bacterium]
MTVFLMVLQVIVAIGLIAVVLMQKSKGEGLGAIGGSAQMFFDQARGLDRVLEKATTYLAVAFMVLSIVISIWG